MGWLGWSEQEAMAADVNAILVAHAGKVDMLNAVFGGGSEQPPVDPEKLPEAAAGMFSRR